MLVQALETYWDVWEKVYLVQLRQQGFLGTDIPIVGELLIVKEDHMPRFYWPLVRVDAIYPKRIGGRVQVAKIIFLNHNHEQENVRRIRKKAYSDRTRPWARFYHPT